MSSSDSDEKRGAKSKKEGDPDRATRKAQREAHKAALKEKELQLENLQKQIRQSEQDKEEELLSLQTRLRATETLKTEAEKSATESQQKFLSLQKQLQSNNQQVSMNPQVLDYEKVRKLTKVIREMISEFPKNKIDLTPWFCSFESILDSLGIEEELYASILLQLISKDLHFAVGKIDKNDRVDYMKVQQFIFHEFQITAIEYEQLIDNVQLVNLIKRNSSKQ